MRHLFIYCLTLLIQGCTSRSPEMVFESFDTFPEGQLMKFENNTGTFEVIKGNVSVKNFGSDENRFLHLEGGEGTTMALSLASNIRKARMVSFSVERVSPRNPFSFSDEARSGNTWKEVFNGQPVLIATNSIPQINIDLDSINDISAFRFNCASSEGTGVYIDNFSVINENNMEFKRVAIRQPITPVLKERVDCNIMDILLETTGLGNPLVLSQITAKISGTIDVNSILSARIYLSNNLRGNEAILFCEADRVTDSIIFRGNQVLTHGINRFWLAVTLKDNVSLEETIDAECLETVINGHKEIPAVMNPKGL